MILMLNCSYKSKNGNSKYFLRLLEKEVKTHSESPCEFMNIKNVLNGEFDVFVEKLRKADALVIGVPLYVDGLPAQAIKLLELLLENHKGKFQKLPVYVVSNLGFYEGIQICHLFDIVENWCKRMGMTYGGGLAIGAGPMISTLKQMPVKAGLNKDIGKGLEKMTQAIGQGEKMENYYCKTQIPRMVYIKAAHMMFGKMAKANGLRVEEVK